MSLRSFHYTLAHPRTTVQHCILGIVAGCCSAILIILFRLSIDGLQHWFLHQGDYFSTLPVLERFALPILAAVLIILFAYLTGFRQARMGIPFVIHRVKLHYGRIPFISTLNQFVGGMLALASGFSVGREGPSVHLGAAGSSFIGQWLKLPHNSIRLLAGCGVAAGISASFNTPFAAVIFVMEVVMREYRIYFFVPVMLAAACGSLLTRWVFGEDTPLGILHFIALHRWMLPYLILFGIGLGALASLFNQQLMNIFRLTSRLNMITRLLVAGAVTGAVGYILPDSMGSGLSAVYTVVTNPDNTSLLVAIFAGKFFLTLIALGLGVPGGIIGPVFGIGVLVGAIAVYPMGLFITNPTDYSQSFALLGMAGLFAAVLDAPLAAVAAVMELSADPQVILPAMLVIVPAYITSKQLFSNESIFIRQMQFQQLGFRTSSVLNSLQQTGVLALMQSDIRIFTNESDSIISDFIQHQEPQLAVKRQEQGGQPIFELIDMDAGLTANPSQHLNHTPMEGVDADATLAEVYQLLQADREGAVYVYDENPNQIIGVIQWYRLVNFLHKDDF